MTATKLITAEELWMIPEVPGKQFELLDGELIEMPGAGMQHTLLSYKLAKLLDATVEPNGLGYVMPDGLSYILRRAPDLVRTPDVSFIHMDRLPDESPPVGFFDGPPDLAVEIVSTHDRATEVNAKVREYLDAGTRLVWVIWPDERSVTVWYPGHRAQVLNAGDILDGGDVLPDLRIAIADLFDITRRTVRKGR